MKRFLLQIEEGSNVEIDSLLSLVPAMTIQTLSLGSSCVSNDGKLMTVIGFYDINNSERDSQLNVGMTDASITHIEGLYYDPVNPERQTVI